MLDLTELKKTADQLISLADQGQQSYSAKLVVARLAFPILDLLAAMESTRGERWCTLTEAIRMSGRNRNYFEKPLTRLGGRCRLEAWKTEGFADQADGRLWLISPVKVAEASRGRIDAPQAAQIPKSSAVDVAAMIELFAPKSA